MPRRSVLKKVKNLVQRKTSFFSHIYLCRRFLFVFSWLLSFPVIVFSRAICFISSWLFCFFIRWALLCVIVCITYLVKKKIQEGSVSRKNLFLKTWQVTTIQRQPRHLSVVFRFKVFKLLLGVLNELTERKHNLTLLVFNIDCSVQMLIIMNR